MQIDRRKIKKILVVRNDRFGEFLLNIPALRALKETFINARIIAVVNPYVKELAETVPFIDEVITRARVKPTLREKFGLICLLRDISIDAAIMLNPSREFNVFTYLAGIPLRVGYDRKWGFLLTHKMKDRKYLGDKHEIEYNLELVGLLGAKTQDKTLALKINETAADSLLKNLNMQSQDRLVALHPWTSDSIKQWPQENFSNLAKKLVKELGVKIIILGGQEEIERSGQLYNNLDSNIINLTGKTSLRELTVILKKSCLLISGDSGPLHLASAVNTPVVAIFRNDIPGKGPKRWGPCSGGSVVIEKNKLSDITVAEVFDKVKEVLNRVGVK
jgi:lipopolysaccharide heptosyltransferase II